VTNVVQGVVLEDDEVSELPDLDRAELSKAPVRLDDEATSAPIAMNMSQMG
jgi:hypothetical protein